LPPYLISEAIVIYFTNLFVASISSWTNICSGNLLFFMQQDRERQRGPALFLGLVSGDFMLCRSWTNALAVDVQRCMH
jgi:hypothetical protein